jgi:hypothetical protein
MMVVSEVSGDPMKRSIFLLLFATLLLSGKVQAQTQHPPTEKTDSKVNSRGGKKDRHRKAKWVPASQRKQQRKARAKKLKVNK